ncbi:MAG: DNA replication/repair protein RecF [Methylococcaceae bacterium]|nr:DNA replication/repair protein RecF [Methylococcaceae bacterium]
MSLNKLDIYSFRNIRKASIKPSSEINFIIGKNASGKSSLLEAIYILGRARSFRSPSSKHVIQFEKTELIVSGNIYEQSKYNFHLGIQISNSGCIIRINQENSGKAELAHSFPVLLIHPKSYKLLDDGPQIRREFMDWGVFNDETFFLDNWRKYKKVLQQRNSLLKTKKTRHINVWDTELVQCGTIVSEYRKKYLTRLESVFIEISRYFFNFDQLELIYLSGWDKSESFTQALENSLNKDIKYGFSHVGPHRSDFQVLLDGKFAKHFVSRGQLKILMLALNLAQIKLFNSQNQNKVCVLIDDLTAELDLVNTQKLLNYLVELNCQVFMSSTELSNFGDLNKISDYNVFHVKHGEIELINNFICST